MASKRIAIACQGGGTHAAFTWGALRTVLAAKQLWDRNGGDSFEVIALSGTSAGALCALAAWYGLVPNTADLTCGSIDKAIERLDFLWTTFAATTPVEIMHNRLVGNLLQWKSRGVPFPGSSPDSPEKNFGLASLAMMGARPEYLGFGALLKALCPDFAAIDWPGVAKADCRVLAGAIEVLSGNFEVFDSNKTLLEMGLLADAPAIDQYSETRWRMRRAISLDGVAASGTLPDILPAQEIPNLSFPTCDPEKTVTRSGYYWDGLFSQNPPIPDMIDVSEKARKPDEIWVIRINPQEIRPASLDLSLEDIRDRENDLAGNLALNQELDTLLTLNRWLALYGDAQPPLDRFKPLTIRTIKMRRETAWGLRHWSKFDRSREHYDALRSEGEAVAEEWLARWRTLGPAFDCYPNDARYPETES